jgi:hypothetical protein
MSSTHNEPQPEKSATPAVDLSSSSIPRSALDGVTPESIIEEALDKMSFDSLRMVFLKRLAGGVEQLLDENSEVSIEKATEIIKSIEILSQGGSPELALKPRTTVTETFDDLRIQGCEVVDGRLNGRSYLKGRYLPILNGKVLTHMEGREILCCERIHSVDGKLNGMLRLASGPSAYLPVINGKMMLEIDGKKIDGCKQIRNIGGQLNGCILVNSQYLPVVDGKVISSIDGKAIADFEEFENIGGKLNGRVAFTTDKYKFLPVIDGLLITHIGEEKITDARRVKNTSGKLNCEAQFVDYGTEWYTVKNGFLKPVKSSRY